MSTPDPRGFPRESQIHRLQYAVRERASHWSFDENLRTRGPRKPRKPKTQEELAADAMKLFAEMARQR